MAKIDEDAIINILKGMLGKQIVVKKAKSGKRYLSAAPESDPNRKLTPAQAKYKERFKRQAVYGKAVSNNPELRKLYEKKLRPGCSVYIMAWRDAHYPPVVRSIWTTGYRGLQGDIIYIQAEDDFKVASVWVSIFDNQDKLIEKGEATFQKDDVWHYNVTTNVKGSKITVIAYDLPWNEGVLSVET